MIGTLAEAGRVLRAPRFIEAAVRGTEFIWTHMRAGGKLLHGWAAGQAKHAAYLDDHAFVASALVDLFEATGDRVHLDRALDLVAALETRFHDASGGGYFFTAHDEERLIARSKSGADGALPSGNAVAALVLLRLHHITGEPQHRARAEEILRLYHDEANKNPFAYASYLHGLEFYLQGPVEVAVIGRRGAAEVDALWTAVAGSYLPNRVLVGAEPGERDPLAPARDRPAVGDHATAYVCRAFTCSAPVTEPASLRPLLEAGA
jgi:uncharacterized protein YyaL (SSP411 family)